MGKREDFMKDLKRAAAGALAGAAVLTGATGCNNREQQNEHDTKIAQPSEGIGRIIPEEEKLAMELSKMSSEELLKLLKEMYVAIDKEKNPESELNPEYLQIIEKSTQNNFFYVEGRNAVVLNGQDLNETDYQLKQTGEKFSYKGIENGDIIIVAYDEFGRKGKVKTIDGIACINGIESPVTTPELLNTIVKNEKTTAQEIPQEIWTRMMDTINLLKNNDGYINPETLENNYDKISELIFENDLQSYLPEGVRPIEYTFEENNELLYNNSVARNDGDDGR